MHFKTLVHPTLEIIENDPNFVLHCDTTPSATEAETADVWFAHSFECGDVGLFNSMFTQAVRALFTEANKFVKEGKLDLITCVVKNSFKIDACIGPYSDPSKYWTIVIINGVSIMVYIQDRKVYELSLWFNF
jgi:hypothetical protein